MGERWTLLIIRELLSGPRRYQELLDNLPGIGTNLLATRLRELGAGSIVQKVRLSAPRVRAYELTEWGRALEPAVIELARWGVTLLGDPRPDDYWSAQWNPLALTARFQADKAAGIDAIYEYGVAISDARVEDVARQRSGQVQSWLHYRSRRPTSEAQVFRSVRILCS